MKRFAGVVFLRQWVRISTLCLGLGLQAQDIPIGAWRTDFSYADARIIVQTSDKVFCAVEHGLFSIDLPTGAVRRLSKIDGLSDAGISAMSYHSSLDVFVIGYRSGLVDFITQSGVQTLTGIADANLQGEKTINAIAFSGDQTFLATDLGVIAVTTADVAIKENYVQIGEGGGEVAIKEIILLNDDLFVLTSQGIQRGNTQTNLLDFNNWEHYPNTANFTDLTVVGQAIYALEFGDLMQLTTSWSDTGTDLPVDADRLYSINDKLLTASPPSIYELNGSTFDALVGIPAAQVNDISLVGSEYWIADGTQGLITQSGTTLSPEGPVSDQYSNVKVVNSTVYAFHAPDPLSYNGSQSVAGFSVFEEGQWSTRTILGFQNASDVAFFGGNLFFSSIGKGLYDETADQVITDIPGSGPSPDTLITALNAQEYLWVSSFQNTHPVHQMDEGGNWTSYPSALMLSDAFSAVDIADLGTLWLTTTSGTITVFDADENTVDQLSAADGLPSTVADVEISIEDDAWVATVQGPAVFPSASFILSNQEILLPTFEGSLLFEGEAVNAIATDGGNRVWFGTDRGLWLFNGTISEQVHLFTIANSPLPSDRILRLTYDDRSGELFIVTDKGMVSYRSASSTGTRAHENVNIFPNPVRPEYTGAVGITGLSANAFVKITDINGNLVKEMRASGGTASWDLLDVRNSKVVTGIYFVFSSSPDGEETFVGKIAVVR